jgi:hypothetical protein
MDLADRLRKIADRLDAAEEQRRKALAEAERRWNVMKDLYLIGGLTPGPEEL